MVDVTLPDTALTEFSWEGWSYCSDEDNHDDCRKIEHYAVKGDTVHHLDFSPYSHMTMRTFQHLVKTGFPRRQDLPSKGPLRPLEAEVLFLRHRVEELEAA